MMFKVDLVKKWLYKIFSNNCEFFFLQKILLVFSIIVVCVSAQGPLIRGIERSLTRAVENAAERVIEREINRDSYGRGGLYNNGFNNGYNQGGFDGPGRYDNYRGNAPIGVAPGYGAGFGAPGVGRGFDRKHWTFPIKISEFLKNNHFYILFIQFKVDSADQAFFKRYYKWKKSTFNKIA